MELLKDLKNYFKKTWLYNLVVLAGIAFLFFIILKDNEAIFTVGFAVIFYSLCNVIIRNWLKGNIREMATDLLDCTLVTLGILFLIKTCTKTEINVVSSPVLFWFLYFGAIILIGVFMFVLVFVGKKRNNHWS